MLSYGFRQIPQTSSSGICHRHAATACHSLIHTFISRAWIAISAQDEVVGSALKVCCRDCVVTCNTSRQELVFVAFQVKPLLRLRRCAMEHAQPPTAFAPLFSASVLLYKAESSPLCGASLAVIERLLTTSLRINQ